MSVDRTDPPSPDAAVLAAYDAALAEWADARQRIETDGVIVTDEKGRRVPHPAIAVERSAAAEMRAWLPEVRRLRATEADGPGW